MRTRILATAIALASDGVERDANGVPTAFRVWKAGPNATDYGVHIFSARSAELLMAEQETRGNLYSIDVDHLSLNEKAPPESHKAAGWHRLDARKGDEGPELWVVAAEFGEPFKGGLTKDPPEWRYFSPAYEVSKETGEIVSYLNTALTNNPATHYVTALATRIAANRGNMSKFAAVAAALLGDDDDKKKEAQAAYEAMSEEDKSECKKAYAEASIAAAFGEDGGEGGGGGEGGEPKPKPKPDPKDEEATRAAAARRAGTTQTVESTAALLAQIGEQDKRLKALETETEAEKRTKIIAARTDLTDGQRKYLEGRPLKEVEQLLASPLLAPKGQPTTRAAAVQPGVTATRGATQTGGGEQTGAVRATRSNTEIAESIANRFGRSSKKPTIHWEGNELVLERISKADAIGILAARGEAPPPRRPFVPATLPHSMADVVQGALIPEIVRQTMKAALAAKGQPVSQ